jgi:hypothetical protein
MQIGLADDDFEDAQDEEDFYYDDYNDDDEEQAEIWEDAEEIYLDFPPRPPELLHAPDRRGKKWMCMQRLFARRYDAEASASVASLFLSLPQPALGEGEECDLSAGARCDHDTQRRSSPKGRDRCDVKTSACESTEIRQGGIAMVDCNEMAAADSIGDQVAEGEVAGSACANVQSVVPEFQSGIDGENLQFESGAEEQVGSHVGSPVNLAADEGVGEGGVYLHVGLLPP